MRDMDPSIDALWAALKASVNAKHSTKLNISAVQTKCVDSVATSTTPCGRDVRSQQCQSNKISFPIALGEGKSDTLIQHSSAQEFFFLDCFGMRFPKGYDTDPCKDLLDEHRDRRLSAVIVILVCFYRN